MNTFTELKQVIDSMKSHEDDAVDALQQQLSIIGEQHTDKTEVISVIKMMQSIGRYLGSIKNNADEDALPVLESLSIELEKLVLNPDLDKEQTNLILSVCIQSFNSLKSKTASQPLITSTEMQDLKAVILAVDWEISEKTLKTFDRVTSQILTRLKPHKIHYAFLRIIHSMGRYISSKKATAHKDSIFFLHSVFENFERLVNTPGMPFQEKKLLIESDIDAFHKFKGAIASLKKNSPVIADKIDDEIIQPALSHVKASSKPAPDEVVLLSPLPETSFPKQTQDSDSPTPALAGKKKIAPAPRDIMDDLFNPKESPADELLDAIHLANIHGPDQKRAMNMNEPTDDELQRNGIKNFTPHRIENEPIPEIGNRLDEFFSLDISEDSNLSTAGENDLPLAVTDKSDKGDSTQGVITRLKALVETNDQLDDKSQTAVDKDLSHLKRLWEDDPDKTMLLDLISWLLVKNRSVTVSTDTKTMVDSTESAIPEKLDNPPSGFWGKVKSIFIK